jgi:hypothetical protein
VAAVRAARTRITDDWAELLACTTPEEVRRVGARLQRAREHDWALRWAALSRDSFVCGVGTLGLAVLFAVAGLRRLEEFGYGAPGAVVLSLVPALWACRWCLSEWHEWRGALARAQALERGGAGA